MKALIALVAIDFMTGVLAAYTEKKLNSEEGYKGIIRKVCIFLMVAVAQIIDISSGLGEPCLRTAVIMFFIANESPSAMENMGRMGVPLPEPLKAALEKLHGRGGKISAPAPNALKAIPEIEKDHEICSRIDAISPSPSYSKVVSRMSWPAVVSISRSAVRSGTEMAGSRLSSRFSFVDLSY